MIAVVISRPSLDMEAIKMMGYIPHPPGTVSPGDELVEINGRLCYRSWGRPNPQTATNEDYIANIIQKNHTSIMEHSQYTFYIAQVSRALTHEFIRHRHLSPSQVSQRYVDESEGEFILPPEVVNSKALLPDLLLTDSHHDALSLYLKVYETLASAGIPRKRARQAARYALPNGHATELSMSGNLRAWRHFLNMRLAVDEKGLPYADLEMHQLATLILHRLREEAPNSVQDLWAAYGH